MRGNAERWSRAAELVRTRRVRTLVRTRSRILQRETGLESVFAANSSERKRIHDPDSANLADFTEPQSTAVNSGCTIAPKTPRERRDPVAIALLQAHVLWAQGVDVRAVRAVLLDALRLLDED